MKIQVKLFASLRKYLPAGTAGDTITIEVATGATVRDAISALGIPAEHARMIVSANEQLEPTATLREGQRLDVFPPLAGGA